MSIPIKIFISNQAYEGKLINTNDEVSLLFTTENGRYYILATAISVKITLSGEVGYKLTINKMGRSHLSVCYGETYAYPTDLTLLSFEFISNKDGGKIAVTYSIADDEYNQIEPNDDNINSFELTYKTV